MFFPFLRLRQLFSYCVSIFFIASGVGLSPLYCGHFWPIVPAPEDRGGWLWSNWWNEDWQGKPKYSEKTCHSATWSTTNPTWPDPGSNPGRRSGKPAANRLSYSAALRKYLISYMLLLFCLVSRSMKNKGSEWSVCLTMPDVLYIAYSLTLLF
jgi:hypothetical protein